MDSGSQRRGQAILLPAAPSATGGLALLAPVAKGCSCSDHDSWEDRSRVAQLGRAEAYPARKSVLIYSPTAIEPAKRSGIATASFSTAASCHDYHNRRS